MVANTHGAGGAGDLIAVGFGSIQEAAAALKSMMSRIQTEHEALQSGIDPLRQVWVAADNPENASDAADLYESSTRRLNDIKLDLARLIGDFSAKADAAAALQSDVENRNRGLFG